MFEATAFRDALPDGCPPNEAETIRDPRVVYRAVHRDVDPIGDFQSVRQESPNFRAPAADECILCGVTVFATQRAARQALKHGKGHKWAGKQVGMLTLPAGAGAILRTAHGQPTEHGEHWTWWPASGFDPLPHVEVL